MGGGPSLPALLVVLSQSLCLAAHLCEALGTGARAHPRPAFLGGLHLCQNVPDLSLSQLEEGQRTGGEKREVCLSKTNSSLKRCRRKRDGNCGASEQRQHEGRGKNPVWKFICFEQSDSISTDESICRSCSQVVAPKEGNTRHQQPFDVSSSFSYLTGVEVSIDLHNDLVVLVGGLLPGDHHLSSSQVL